MSNPVKDKVPFSLFGRKKLAPQTVTPAPPPVASSSPAPAPASGNAPTRAPPQQSGATTVVDEPFQRLGSTLTTRKGNFDIRCKLEGRREWAPKWCTTNNQLRGVFYFEFEFTHPRDIPLDYAIVRVKFSEPANTAPEPLIDEHAPKNGIRGSGMSHQTNRENNVNPNVGIPTPAGSLNLSGYENRRGVQSTPTRYWQFSSSDPSDLGTGEQSVEFKWTHGWDDDYDALERKFRGAITIERPVNSGLAMIVQVEAKTLKGWQKALPVAEKPSKVLNPQNPITAADFDTLILELNEKIENENAKMAPATVSSRPAPGGDQQTIMGPQLLPAGQNAAFMQAPGMYMPQLQQAMYYAQLFAAMQPPMAAPQLMQQASMVPPQLMQPPVNPTQVVLSGTAPAPP